MALIRCPECGKEVSDQAQACIHCGYPLKDIAANPPRYALVLLEATFDYPNMIRRIQDLPGYDDYTAAKALADAAPAVLQRGLPYEDAVAQYGRFRPYGSVKLVRDEGERVADAELIAAEPVPIPEKEEKQGMGFGMTVLAVVLGVVAALLILSIF